jgi:hypothetical protein
MSRSKYMLRIQDRKTPRILQTLIDGLLVYGPPPELKPSDQYTVAVKTTGEYRDVFTFQSKVPYANAADARNNTYYENLCGWSHSYANFVMGKQPVRVKVTNRTGVKIIKAKVYPKTNVSDILCFGNSVEFTMKISSNIMVDINQTMETVRDDRTNPPPADRNNYDAGTAPNPIHTISIHGNRALKVPNITSTTIYKVNPGTIRAKYNRFANSTADILYFKPGIHYLGEDFKVTPNRAYYIPGDAIVFGTFNNHGGADAENVEIFGHGTISGGLGADRKTKKELLHWKMRDYGKPVIDQDPDIQKFHEVSYKKRPIDLLNCQGSIILGIAIVDPANNSIAMHHVRIDDESIVKNVKIFAWRANSDGGGCNDSSIVSNLFYRCQDDCLYPSGKVLRDCVFWTDSNGANMRLSFLRKPLAIRNIDFIFRRNQWWSDSACIHLPSDASGEFGNGVIFSNINITDPKPVRPAIKIHLKKFGRFTGIRFNNVTIARLPRYKDGSIMKNELFAKLGAKIKIQFTNLKIEGVTVTQDNWNMYFEKYGDVSVSFNEILSRL